MPFLSRAQAAGSWSKTACCAVSANTCGFFGQDYCVDNTAASDFIFRLQPGEPQFFLPTGTGSYRTRYQYAGPSEWPSWGHGYDLNMGSHGGPPGANGYCDQGDTYAGSPNEAWGGGWDGNGKPCEGLGCWGPTDMEVWIPVDCSTESRCAATCYGGTGIRTCDGVYYCCDVCTGNHPCAAGGPGLLHCACNV